MALTSVNRLFERPGRVEVFLALAPTVDPLASPTGVAATDNPLRLAEYYKYFYADAAARKALKAGVVPYAAIDTDGVTSKVKANPIEVDPNSGSKHTIGFSDFESSIEFPILDSDAAHFADLFGARAEDKVSTAAAAGVAGRLSVLFGAQKMPTKVVALLRMPSVLVPGEYDNKIFFRAAMTLDAEEKFQKKNATNVKVSLSCQNDVFMVDSDGTGHIGAVDNALVAAL
jgi:hypothetical protein